MVAANRKRKAPLTLFATIVLHNVIIIRASLSLPPPANLTMNNVLAVLIDEIVVNLLLDRQTAKLKGDTRIGMFDNLTYHESGDQGLKGLGTEPFNTSQLGFYANKCDCSCALYFEKIKNRKF